MADEYRQAAADKLDYPFDWSAWLAKVSDTIATSVFTVTPTGLTINSPAASFTTTNATVWCSGGVEGQRYKVFNKITTATGRTRTRWITVQIQSQ